MLHDDYHKQSHEMIGNCVLWFLVLVKAQRCSNGAIKMWCWIRNWLDLDVLVGVVLANLRPRKGSKRIWHFVAH